MDIKKNKKNIGRLSAFEYPISIGNGVKTKINVGLQENLCSSGRGIRRRAAAPSTNLWTQNGKPIIKVGI